MVLRLQSIRRHRYTVSDSEITGRKDIAVLVGNPVVGTTAAPAIACLKGGKDKATIQHLIGALQNCAARITTSLGLNHDRSFMADSV